MLPAAFTVIVAVLVVVGVLVLGAITNRRQDDKITELTNLVANVVRHSNDNAKAIEVVDKAFAADLDRMNKRISELNARVDRAFGQTK